MYANLCTDFPFTLTLFIFFSERKRYCHFQLTFRAINVDM